MYLCAVRQKIPNDRDNLSFIRRKIRLFAPIVIVYDL